MIATFTCARLPHASQLTSKRCPASQAQMKQNMQDPHPHPTQMRQLPHLHRPLRGLRLCTPPPPFSTAATKLKDVYTAHHQPPPCYWCRITAASRCSCRCVIAAIAAWSSPASSTVPTSNSNSELQIKPPHPPTQMHSVRNALVPLRYRARDLNNVSTLLYCQTEPVIEVIMMMLMMMMIMVKLMISLTLCVDTFQSGI